MGFISPVPSFPNYGELSGRKVEDISLLESRVEPSPFKKDPRDFALWKSRKPNETVWWHSPWGDGRPGWHIECTVISVKFAGFPLDFHGGGSDLIFPHHENEKHSQKLLLVKNLSQGHGCILVCYASAKKRCTRAWVIS